MRIEFDKKIYVMLRLPSIEVSEEPHKTKTKRSSKIILRLIRVTKHDNTIVFELQNGIRWPISQWYSDCLLCSQIFDAFIIVSSFTIDIVFLSGVSGEEGQKAAAVLVILLLWRIARVVDGILTRSVAFWWLPLMYWAVAIWWLGGGRSPRVAEAW